MELHGDPMCCVRSRHRGSHVITAEPAWLSHNYGLPFQLLIELSSYQATTVSHIPSQTLIFRPHNFDGSQE